LNSRFIIFVSIVQIILWLGHAFLYVTAVTFLPVDAAMTGIVFAALSLTFVTANLIAFRSDSSLARLYYGFAAIWLGAGHYLMMASVLIWLAYGAVEILSLAVSPWWFGLAGVAAALIMTLYSLTNARTLRVSRYEVRLSNLPAAWRGRRAIWASDIHLGHLSRIGWAKKVAAKIRALNPDIVFIGGDLFDGVDFQAKTLLAPLADVTAPLGVFFVTGNHEEFGDPARFIRPIREAGLRVLDNELIDIDGLQLVGVDYARTASPEAHRQVMQRIGIDPGKPSILLMHAPTHLDVSATAGISLQISGHTHRGQLLPFPRITRRVYGGFDYGLKRFGDMQVIVSSGAGTWGPPMRSGSPTEIVEITFV